MDIQRGFRDKIEKYAEIFSEIDVEMNITGGSVYDFCCFGVDNNGCLSDDRYMVFFNQQASANNEIIYKSEGNSALFKISLAQLPSTINKLVFTASIDGNGKMKDISSHRVRIIQNGRELINFELSGADFFDEKAIISIEIYQKDCWRFAAIANGFNGGLRELLKFYGGEEAMPQETPAPVKTTPIKSVPPVKPKVTDMMEDVSPQNASRNINQYNNNPAPVSNAGKKVELRKGQKVSLEKKHGTSLGEVHINLNWHQPQRKGLAALFMPSGIDLDLGCLFEMKDGRKGCIQALGKTFGSYSCYPYITLDGDDRTGSVTSGENIRINGAHISEIRRILIYTFIYEGAANWREADGVVTIKCPGSQEIIVKMDEYGSSQKMCAIAMLENVNNETFSVEKLVQFFNGHRYMDRAYSWGMEWIPGRK